MNWPITNIDLCKQKLHNLTNASAHKLSVFLMQALENKQGKKILLKTRPVADYIGFLL